MDKNYHFQGCWIKGKDVDYGKDDSEYYQDHRNCILVKEFYLEHIQETYLYIATLGYSIIYLNNQRIGHDELNLVWTQFQKCVYYDCYDVTSYLKEGQNQIKIELGNGMFNPSPLRLFGKYNLRERLGEIGEPRILCDLVSHNQVILSSDASWMQGEGHFLFNNLYLGERVDLRLEMSVLKPVETKENIYHLEANFIPRIRRFQNVQSLSMIETDEGVLIDFNEMISGFINISFKANAGQKVRLQYSERCVHHHMDYKTCLAGSVGEEIHDFVIPGGLGAPKKAIQTDEIISKQGINHFTNTFTYHSFRYVLIEGLSKADIYEIYATYVHTDLKQIGNVKTDHTFYNELFDVAMRTKLNNVHGTFEDCARERLGYGGDMVALATSNLYTFDLEHFYKKIIRDFRYEQTPNGGIPETAPYMGIQSNGTAQREGPLLWQLVYPYLTYKHYQFYGDRSLLEEEYPYLNKQLNYLLSFDLEEVVEHCLGDHGSILIAGEFRKPTPDKLLLGYCTMLLLLRYNIGIAKILHKETNMYEQRYDEIKKITIQKFKNEDGSFGEGTQSGYAFAIALGLDDERLLCQKFVEKIQTDQGIFNSGIFGMALTYEILAKYGYHEVIENWLLQESDIGFKAMLSNGNKALAELFVGEQLSLNHAMFASYQQWYYQGLAGICIENNAVAFDKMKLKPYFSKLVNHVECCIQTKQGMIQSNWQRKNNNIEWIILIPENIQYEICLDQDYQKEISDQQIIIHTLG
ncbi:MAG: family 78 glycoside hydrolase catalytic domain [Coprobacillus cateniformis]|uniref:family 78 glycoside hydrolase catalytic domain n=1 Tax=Longibaculum muris TaxID=1796628 RepID=UPI003AB15D01|nr:family 78 glycoside hydrolase catalytic domain [Coprobacillus cateniformis]